MTIRAPDVFTPGAYPVHTYVERTEAGLEQMLRDALDTPGQVVSLSGPSKSGKTVLVERVVTRDNLISVSGAGIVNPDDIWDRVLDWMGAPASIAETKSVDGKLGGEMSVTGGLSLPGVLKGETEAKGLLEVGGGAAREATRTRRGLKQVEEEIANSSFVILLDDFHYMPRDVQIEAAKAIKEAVRLGVKIVTAAVRHRGDDVVRALPELRGRVKAIDLDYWKPAELREIAEAGFGKLNVQLDGQVLKRFLSETAGSPQLMQLICLQACFSLGLRERRPIAGALDVNGDRVSEIFEQTSSSTDFRSLVDVLHAGPKTRGTERKIYRFIDESHGDVYRCVLKAIATDPPKLSLSYEQLTNRVRTICVGEAPVGSSVTGTCSHMTRLAQDRFPSERVVDWDEQKQILDIPDPYLLFYLRWSGRLREPDAE